MVSHRRAVKNVSPGYTHSGKIDRDNGIKPKRAKTAAKRTMRRIKKKIRKFLDANDAS